MSDFCGVCRKWDPEHSLCNVNGLPATEFDDACASFASGRIEDQIPPICERCGHHDGEECTMDEFPEAAFTCMESCKYWEEG